ncbi:hypothetical protein ACVXHA_17875 [Escherichia coli]
MPPTTVHAGLLRQLNGRLSAPPPASLLLIRRQRNGASAFATDLASTTLRTVRATSSDSVIRPPVSGLDCNLFTVQAYHHPDSPGSPVRGAAPSCIIISNVLSVTAGLQAGELRISPARSRDSSLIPRASRYPQYGFPSAAPLPFP